MWKVLKIRSLKLKVKHYKFLELIVPGMSSLNYAILNQQDKKPDICKYTLANLLSFHFKKINPLTFVMSRSFELYIQR